MEDYSKEMTIKVTKTLDKHIGLVLDIEHEVCGGCFFLCWGQWVSLSQCEEYCPKYTSCSKVGQVMMIGSETYTDGLASETKEV